MNIYESLSHSVWDCKYHVVWIPKFRKKVLYGQLRVHMGEILRELARQKESRVVEGHLMLDHVHMRARGYFVSTVGLDEALVREYIKNQEQEDRRLEQLKLV